MKKNIITLLLISAIALTACGSADSRTNSERKQDDVTTREIPLSFKLALGTLQLEKTEFSVDSEQASDLLPLWQVLRSLIESDTAAQEEINAIIEQIQETMTAEQLSAIDNMELTYATANPNFDDKGQKSNSDTPRKDPGFGEKEFSPEQIATAKASKTRDGKSGNQTLIPLIDKVIKLLESK